MRALLCIGCDVYEGSSQLGPLSGAVKDARDVFEALIKPEVGRYDPDRSQLLESPTLGEVTRALTDFAAKGAVDTFTFYFAGHGVQKAGACFLCLRDTTEQYSTTAYNVVQLFSVINETQPLQSNVVIDACQAAGVVFDLATLIKPELIGSAGTQGVSILAACALDQIAGESPEGGFMTRALLQCVNGELKVQDSRQSLDLIEIGRVVSSQVSLGSNQKPSCWGLNLYGEGRFCANPHRPGPDSPSDLLLSSVRSAERQSDSIRAHSGAVWEIYQSIHKVFEVESALGVLRGIVDTLAHDKVAMCAFVRGISETFKTAAARGTEIFLSNKIDALCSCLLLPYTDDAVVTACVRELAGSQLKGLATAIDRTERLVEAHPFCLALMEGTAGFFYLPVLLSELLGWMGVEDRVSAWLGVDDGPRLAQRARFFDKLLELYLTAFRVHSDAQAAMLAPAFAALKANGMSQQRELLAGLLFSSLVRNKGRVLSEGADGKAAAIFVLGEGEATGEVQAQDVARPASVLPMLLVAMRDLGFGEVIDVDLHTLDHHVMNVFVPASFHRFADPSIAGANFTYEIGEGIWAVDDFLAEWDQVSHRIPRIDEPATRIGAVNASMLFPDRVSWFLFL